MSFDPTKPADNSPIVGQDFRDQFNALKALIDTLTAQMATLQPVPVIAKIDGSHFSIAWFGANPLEWAIQVQGVMGGIWDFDHAIDGALRTSDDVGNPYAVRIVGRDAGHNPVTDVSNVLILN